ncbi:hypothetical protein A5699_20130 [Mycobacterium sp. E802]|uniref:hypothetical protein n=1 Tax=Mycobacterium sp. E802 TaxID=1834152 RepID=UPI0007FEB46C|nr:hypothetical protein [Mycobacterium sp. E802]OBG87019.1 hypothetical protein A5699_20130 [Mycobacterium sp. E802]
MAADTNVTDEAPSSPTSEPKTDEVPNAPGTASDSPSAQQRVWTMPKPAVTRKHVDECGRIALKAGAAVVGFIAAVARFGVRTLKDVAQVIDAVPSTVRQLTVLGLLTLLGVVGAIALSGTVGLVCIVVVVPVCSIALGALGNRWYSGQSAPRTQRPIARASTPELQRSVEYVDTKLTVALNAFGAEHQQQAMIALFQAKTAVELTLGTEQDAASHVDALLAVEGHEARPRIRAGSAPKPLRESNSLAAS